MFTIGYEQLLPDPLVAELEAAGVRRLIDVRFRPQSRRPGMSKTRLAARLAESGIAYEHRRGLGTPADIRWYYKHGQVEEGARRFRAHIDGSEDVEALADELRAGAPPTALMCLEANPAECHRRILAEALAERLPALTVTDL